MEDKGEGGEKVLYLTLLYSTRTLIARYIFPISSMTIDQDGFPFIHSQCKRTCMEFYQGCSSLNARLQDTLGRIPQNKKTGNASIAIFLERAPLRYKRGIYRRRVTPKIRRRRSIVVMQYPYSCLEKPFMRHRPCLEDEACPVSESANALRLGSK